MSVTVSLVPDAVRTSVSVHVGVTISSHATGLAAAMTPGTPPATEQASRVPSLDARPTTAAALPRVNVTVPVAFAAVMPWVAVSALTQAMRDAPVSVLPVSMLK